MSHWITGKDAERVVISDADVLASITASAVDLVEVMKRDLTRGADEQMASDIVSLLDAAVPIVELAMRTVAETRHAERFTTVLQCAAMLLNHAAKMTTPALIAKEGGQ